MDFEVPKFISNLVENQFPSFYKEDGENFVLFLKAYYEWMEDDWGNDSDGLGGPVREARELLDYRDIDNTIEKFLEFFQKKYLYGIPFSVIANKRFLLKHILDVYRSKGTIQCYRLLFKLLYNEDVEIYLPSRDVLRASDGLWIQPRYVEVSANSRLPDYIGKTIIGVTSKVTATVEQYAKENYNNDVINVIYISNITPRIKEFQVGEKLVLLEEINDTDAINAAPSVLGSLNNITVINGGQNYNIGDVIKIVHRDLSNNDVISFGKDGILNITELGGSGLGSLRFYIAERGFGFTANASTFVYRNEDKEENDADASFSVGSLINTRILSYNTDLVCNYSNLQLSAATYGFPANENANLVSTIEDTFSYSNNTFGSIFNLADIETGNGYSFPANVFVRSTLLSDQLEGNVSFNTSSNTVTGDGSIFTSVFSNGDIIALQSNSSLSSTIELQVIKEVINSTSIILYGPPSANTSEGKYRVAPTILPAQYANYEDEISSYEQIVGENENIAGLGVVVGSLRFDIEESGFGFTANASTFVYRNEDKVAGDEDASFSVGSLTNSRILSYNTDLVCNYSNLQLSTATYGFPANENANLVSTIGDTFSYSNNTFGGIFNLDNIKTGNGYYVSANVFVRSTLLSDQLEGNVAYNTSSSIVTGDGSIFTSIFSNGDIIALQSNGYLSSTIELQVIKEVINSTSIILYGPPSSNATAGKYRVAPTILPAQYANYEDEISSYEQVVGETEIITGTPNLSNNTVLSAEAINSGKGYVQGEEVTAYLSGGVSNNILIIESGQNYTNGEILVFAGGNPGVVANGYIMTDNNGSISSTTITYGGSGYESVPVVRVRSTNGSGASLKATIQEFNTESQIKARINKTGIGKGRGYWDTTRGFISADKYIQDSYYYQDYSYEIRVARTLNKYKNIINDTFHVAGAELFGKYLKYLIGTSNANLVYESSSTSSITIIYLYASETSTTADANNLTVDSYFYEV